jgi:aspartyl-tRNA(Asn)/glutamyl-tRNA(Gln) amidotransferase subunit C
MVASSVPHELSRDEVERIARLAHLELTEDEISHFARQLADILSYADRVQQVDTTGVAATAHVLAQHPALRADEVLPSLPRSAGLANAPDKDGDAGLFKVPRVLG